MSKPKTAERGRKVGAAPPPPPPPRSLFAARRAARAERAPRVRADVAVESYDERQRPTWRSVAALVISLFALGVSIYLTLTHYDHAVTLVCSNTGAVNCEAVTTSTYSMIFGIPVAVLGLVFWVPMLAINLPWAWRSANRFVAPLRLAMSVTSVGFVFYLLFAELYEIKKICLWCTSVHILTFLMFVLVATGWDEARAPALEAAGDFEEG